MPTYAEIKKQIAESPHHVIFWTWKEVRALPALLDKDERIHALTSGMLDGATWLLVCTNRRIVFLNCGMFFGQREVQIPLDVIQSIDHESSLFFGTISIWDGASAFTVSMVQKSSIVPFIRATEEAMYALRKKTPHVTPAKPLDVATQLEKLVELKEKGYLTEAEFQEQKKKILS